MPKYKLILTVQDSYGMTKEIEAGIVEDNLDAFLSDADLEKIATAMDKVFATEAEAAELVKAAKQEVVEELPDIIADESEINEAIVEAVEKNADTIKYSSFVD